MRPPEIETERLLLRPFRAADLNHIQRYASRPEFYRYLLIPEQTPDTVRAFLKGVLDCQEMDASGRRVFAMELKACETVVGSLRIETREAVHRNGDLGFALDSNYWGHGYMTEAVGRLLEFGFDELELHRIWATADVRNDRSWRLMERVGMKREGLLRQNKLLRGEWRNSYIYAVLADERKF